MFSRQHLRCPLDQYPYGGTSRLDIEVKTKASILKFIRKRIFRVTLTTKIEKKKYNILRLGFIFMVVNQKSMMPSLDLTTQFSWLIAESTTFIFINLNTKEMFLTK